MNPRRKAGVFYFLQHIDTISLTTSIDAPGIGAFAKSSPTGNSLIIADNSTQANLVTQTADNIVASGPNNTLKIYSYSAGSTLDIIPQMSGVQTLQIVGENYATQAGQTLDLSTSRITGLTSLVLDSPVESATTAGVNKIEAFKLKGQSVTIQNYTGANATVSATSGTTAETASLSRAGSTVTSAVTVTASLTVTVTGANNETYTVTNGTVTASFASSTGAQTTTVAATVTGTATGGSTIVQLASTTDTSETLTLNNVTAGTGKLALQVDVAGSYAAALNVVSNGTANKITLTDSGAALTSVVVTGAGALALDASAISDKYIKTINASGATGKLTLTVGAQNTALTSITGGSGNDTFNIDGLYGAVASPSTFVLAGGAGVDTVSASQADLISWAALTSNGITSIENVKVASAVTLGAAASLNLAKIGGATNIEFGGTLTVDKGATNAYTETISGLVSGSTVTFDGDVVNTATGGTAANGLILTVTGAQSATNDVVNFVLNQTTSSTSQTIAPTTLNYVETLNIQVNTPKGADSGTTTISGITDAQLTSIVISSGAVDANLNAVSAQKVAFGTGFNTALLTTINASAASGAVDVTNLYSNLIATGATITGGAGVLTAKGSVGADTFITGAGGGSITTSAAIDTVNLLASVGVKDAITATASTAANSALVSGYSMSATATVDDTLAVGTTTVMTNASTATQAQTWASGNAAIANLTFTASSGIITFGGSAAATASLATLTDAAVRAIYQTTGGAGAAAFQYNGNTYVVTNDNNASGTYTNAVEVTLVGLTGATALNASTHGASTIFLA